VKIKRKFFSLLMLKRDFSTSVFKLCNPEYLTKKSSSYISLFALTVFVASTFFLSYSIESFFDFDRYESYITNGSALVRFRMEPISAISMYFWGRLGLGAFSYHLLIWIFFGIVCYVMAKKSGCYFWEFLFLLLVFNPASMILLQTPRFLLGFIFFLVALLQNGFRRLLFLLLAFFSHNLLGLYAFFISFTMKFRLKTQFFFFVIGLISIYFLLKFGSSQFSSYIVDQHDRGWGRLMLFTITLPIYFLQKKLKNKEAIYVIFLSMLSFVLFTITPYTHRILTINTFLLFVLIFQQRRSFSSFLFLIACFIFNYTSFIYIIFMGKYGFG
jgi:hypothetical protein